MNYSFKDIVKEISELTGLPSSEVEFRVWKEALNKGWDVLTAASEFDINPNIYNKKWSSFTKQLMLLFLNLW